MSAFELVRTQAAQFPVSVLCRLLNVSTSGYYAWFRRGHSTRRAADLRVVTKIRAIHGRTRGVYGSRRMARELDEPVGRNRLARLMRDHGLKARGSRRFRATTDSNHDRPVAPNLLSQNFSTHAPNCAWVDDITYVRTADGWFYLAVILDLFSRKVIRWAFDDNMRRKLPLTALKRALGARAPAPGLIRHTDRGSRYASSDYQDVLVDHEVACSMSRAGDCYDNAVAESFLASLKKECLHLTLRHPYGSVRRHCCLY